MTHRQRSLVQIQPPQPVEVKSRSMRVETFHPKPPGATGVLRQEDKVQDGPGRTSDGFMDAARLINTVTPPSGNCPFLILPFRGSFPAPPEPRARRPLSAGQRAKLRIALRGRALPAEHRAKVTAALRRPETRAKLSAAH